VGPAINDRYRGLVESSPDGIFISQHDRILFANRAAVQLFAADDPEQLLGTSTCDLFQSGSRPQIRERLRAWAAGDQASAVEVEIARLDGTATPAEVSGASLADGNGPAIQLIVRDITGRKRAEAALRESEERLRLAFAGAQEGVWDWNLDTGAVVYSSRWKQMLGYADDEIEPHVSAWERLLHPDDRDRARQINESARRGARWYEGEFRLRHKDGHYVHVLSRGYPVRREHDGAVERIVGTHFDLTERKHAEAALRESEERLRLAFAGAQEGVWDWNLETGAVVYSAHWKQMLGYADHEIEPHVSAWERLLHPDDWPRARELNDRVARGAKTYEGEFRLRHKDGHYVQVLSRGFPVRREAGGPVVRIVGTHFDLTERKAAEAERARTELLAHLVFAQEDERRRIAREMHDQFGEQLTTLALRIGALRAASRDNPAFAELVDALEAVAQQLDRDVDQLVWQLRPTALDDLGLRAALTNYVQDWSRRVGIAAELHTAGLLDDRLPSDVETALYRIAQEALTNVARHARATQVEIILERRGDHVLLAVEDNGVGFEQTTEGDAGQGFGLHGMRERASLIGATLEIESAAGQGTTILVRKSVGSERPIAPGSTHA
jgi:PAS domain S-box-containing protein